MPARNLLVICLAAIISLACYHRAAHNRWASTIANAIGTIEANFVEPIDSRELFEGSMNGMVKQLDEYSGYVSPDAYDQLLEDLDQEFGGVGIIVDVDPDTERLMVLSPFVGTPAYDAGMRAGDLIMAIEGQDTEGLDSSDTIKMIRGAPGTDVTLTILPFGEKDTRQVTLTRAIIPIESVLGDRRLKDGSWEFFLEAHPEIGYIRLSSFGENTADDLKDAYLEVAARDQETLGLIIDLRQNPGGLLETAVEVCDLFLSSGDIVSIRGRDKLVARRYEAKNGTLVSPDLPLAILVDHYSASASEIVSACLQDHERAIIIGERSWGKGTVQSVLELEGGRSALRLTTATYWRPSGKNIHRLAKSKTTDDWGVSPNEGYEVKFEKDEFLNVLRERRKRDVVMTRSGKDNPNEKDDSNGAAVGNEDAQDSPATPPAEPANNEFANQTNGDSSDVESTNNESTDVESTNNESTVDRQLEKAIEYIQGCIHPATKLPEAA